MDNFFNTNKFDRKTIHSKVPWVDKYRPKKLNDIIQQDEIKTILKNLLISGNIPHLLLYGPPGTGKTSTILACCNELFGPINFNNRVIELNASDERGINIVRTKIIDFAKKSLSNSDKNFPSPSFKIIILDEADAMTVEAQSALRKIIEDYSNTTRFCFICNYINQIIDPIISRCMKFRFKPILKKNIILKLQDICNKENFIINNKYLKLINNISNGDSRKAIMILQNLKYIYDFNNNSITKKDIYNITGYVSVRLLNKILLICIDKNTNLNDILNIVDKFRLKGYPINSILNSLCINILNSEYFNDIQKSDIFFNISICEKKLIDGADEYVQIVNIFTYIYNIIKYPNNNIVLDCFL
jgi:replication factor C subunit 2/4